MSEQKTQDINPTKEKRPVGFSWLPEDTITISGREFTALVSVLRLFENANTAKTLIQQRHINTGLFKPFFEEDLDVDGNLKPDFGKEPVVEEVQISTND